MIYMIIYDLCTVVLGGGGGTISFSLSKGGSRRADCSVLSHMTASGIDWESRALESAV